MADQTDQQIAYSNASATRLMELQNDRYNKGGEHGSFNLTVPADAHYSVVGVKTAVALNPSQRAALQTAIAAITGVQAARVLMHGTTPPAAHVPANHHIEAVGGIRFRIEPDPAP